METNIRFYRIALNYSYKEICFRHTFYVQWLFVQKSCRLYDSVEKFVEPGRPTDDNMAHAHCMLDTQGYRHTLRICNTLLLFHCNSGCTKSPERYAVRILPVLLRFCRRTLDVCSFSIETCSVWKVAFIATFQTLCCVRRNNLYLHEGWLDTAWLMLLKCN
jgi:hypothetical protein